MTSQLICTERLACEQTRGRLQLSVARGVLLDTLVRHASDDERDQGLHFPPVGRVLLPELSEQEPLLDPRLVPECREHEEEADQGISERGAAFRGDVAPGRLEEKRRLVGFEPLRLGAGG